MAKEGAPEHVGSGICAVAAAVLAAKDVTREEYELAEKILGRKFPRNDNPRELEFAATTFNRHMDAAIDACNRSQRKDSRVARRAALARDLDHAGLVLLEREMVAALIAKARELEGRLAEEIGGVDDRDLGAELLLDDDQPLEVVVTVAAIAPPNGVQISPSCTISIDAERYTGPYEDGNGASYTGLEFIEGNDRVVALDPGVND